MDPIPCPQCSDPAAFSKRRGRHYCAECEFEFGPNVTAPGGGGGAESSQGAGLGRAHKPLKLFLSYGHDELIQEVAALRDALRARGHEVWFDDERLRTGDWEHRIENGLIECDRVVLTMTPHSVRRPDGYCLNEIAKALELRKPIIPVLLVDVPEGAPTSICRIQYLDWRDAVPAAEKAERFVQRLKRLCEAIEENKLDFEGGQQRLIRHLQPLNFDGDLQRHVASFKGRVQLEARLHQWLADPAASQVLWLTAAPGLGKSAVAATLSHRWAGVAAVHFCVAGHQDKANPARAVLSIAYQLSQRQHMSLYAGRLSSLELEREAHKDPRTLFDTLLVGPLAANFPAPPEPLLVIIDGLDEATQPGGLNPLAEIVAADWGRLPSWLRLMVSSRPEAELVTWLAGTHRLEIRGDDAEQQADLAAFLEERLSALGRPPNKAVLNRILQRSEGAFHYAVLLLEEVRLGRCNPENPVDLPAGLNPFYLQTFRRRFPDAATYRAQTLPLLELILAAPEPVPLAVLAGATTREPADVRQDLSALGSMVAIEPCPDEPDADWDTVRLSHASLRSWLTGLDSSRQSLAGAYAAKADTRGLAAVVLNLWEAGNDPKRDVQDMTMERRAFVARTLWTLLKASKDEPAMERVAFDLSLYWEHRKLALAIGPGEFAAERAWKSFESGTGEIAAVEHFSSILFHLAALEDALGRSQRALDASYKFLKINQFLAERDPQAADSQVRLSDSHTRIGGLLEIQGNLGGALDHVLKGLTFIERLATQDPQNVEWQDRLSVSYNRIGDIVLLQGDLTGALERFRKALDIRAHLAAQDPQNTGWQRGLAVSYGRIGDILNSEGNLEDALKEFRKALAIKELFAAQEPQNADLQFGLSGSYVSIGGILERQGDSEGALEEFRKALAINKRLTAQDPQNASWQYGLSVTHNDIGSIFQSECNITGALEEFRKALAIKERLAEQDPRNADWQNGLSINYMSAGDILESQGDLAGALEEFRRALAIKKRLTAQDPINAYWRMGLSVMHHRIGCIHASQGNLAAALQEFREALAIRERLATQDPKNAYWRKALRATCRRVGTILSSQNNLAGALEEFRKALAINEQLSAQDPKDVGWQTELCDNYRYLGDFLESHGDLAGALEEFRKALAINESLAEQDPQNADWQVGISDSYESICGVLKTQGDLLGALEEARKALAIEERLAAQDPQNARWQSGLSGSYGRIGRLLEKQGDLAGALKEFRKALAISELHAEQDPQNADWQWGLSGSYESIGGILESQGDLVGALKEFKKALAIDERLAVGDENWLQHVLHFSQARVAWLHLELGDFASAKSPADSAETGFRQLRCDDDPSTLINHTAALALCAELAQRSADPFPASKYQKELAVHPLPPDGLASSFQHRFLPLILKHLHVAALTADPEERARITIRVLRLQAQAPKADFSVWHQTAASLLKTLPPGHELAGELEAV